MARPEVERRIADMPQYHMVIPIHNVSLAPGEGCEFSGGLALTALPAWVSGQKMLDGLSVQDREAIRGASHALVLCYEVDALGRPNPDWKGAWPRTIQETKYEIGAMANLALWLCRPSPVCFAVVLHAPQHGGIFGGQPEIQQTERHSELLCHPNDLEARITTAKQTG